MRRKKRIVIFSTFTIIVAFIIWQYKFIYYGISQLKGQLHIILNVQQVSTILHDPSIPAAWKNKLLLIERIKKFSADSIGLVPSESYSTLYNQHDKPVLWVLTGCKPFQLEAKHWWFPLIGNVSYKGYFDRKLGEQALTALKAEGFDTDLSPVSAWSTLGWFKDPVLSNMLKKNEGALAELIIHELTHGTIFLKSNVDLNENLATYIGEQGAYYFLSANSGDSAPETVRYRQLKNDERIYGLYMLKSQERLDSLYRSIHQIKSTDEKYLAKYRLIAEIMFGVNKLPIQNKQKYYFDPVKDTFPNNTFFMGNKRYRKDQEKLDSLFINRFNKNLKSMVTYLRQESPDEITRLLEF